MELVYLSALAAAALFALELYDYAQ